MNPRWHRVLTQVFLVANSLFWLPWGLINLIWPKSWAGQVIHGMNVYVLSSAVARTEVRAMYGGLQMAIGIFALLGAFRRKYREPALVFFVLALTGLALSRLGGMVAEGEHTYLSFSTTIAPGRYNQVGLAMYELPNMILAWTLLLLRPRRSDEVSEVEALRAENQKLRSQLSARANEPR
jgi:Domain of unknown function (DUF4345)